MAFTDQLPRSICMGKKKKEEFTLDWDKRLGKNIRLTETGYFKYFSISIYLDTTE